MYSRAAEYSADLARKTQNGIAYEQKERDQKIIQLLEAILASLEALKKKD